MQSKRDDAVAAELRAVRKGLADLHLEVTSFREEFRKEILEFRKDVFKETWRIRELAGELGE